MSDKVFRNDYLLPCKWCGGDRETVYDWNRHYVACQLCNSVWPTKSTEEKAIVAANQDNWRDVERDGLPDTPSDCICTFEFEDGTKIVDECKAQHINNESLDIEWDPEESFRRYIIAWMPLPPAYETGSE